MTEGLCGRHSFYCKTYAKSYCGNNSSVKNQKIFDSSLYTREPWALPRQSNNFDLEVRTINSTLCIGFKGKNNASSILVKNISEDSCLLTNSFSGLQRDIEAINVHYDCVVLFGIDKSLKDTVRIEKAAEKETREFSALNLEKISAQLAAAGISNYLSENPTHYLCNDAYWHLLQKFNRKVVLIHIPSRKNISENFIKRLSMAFR